MSRSAATIHRALMTYLPPGWIWPRDPWSGLGALLRPLADELAQVEAWAEEMMDEVDPRTARRCLSDFERVLGEDPCGRDPADLSVSDRQDLAHQRWTARGGASIAYFVALAAKRGVVIEVEECHESQCGAFECGMELVEPPEQYVWVVSLDLGKWSEFEAGANTAGERLYDYALSDIECDIRRLKPAHTEVVFIYQAAVSAPELALDEWPVIHVTAQAAASVQIHYERAD